MTRCAVCERPCVREVEPACGGLPAVNVPDVWQVVFRNRLVFPACDVCWGKWPDDWKRFPEVGFGRTGKPAENTPSNFGRSDVLAVLRATA